MAQGKLGFGFMRLPLLSTDQTDIDREQLNQMVDLFIEKGFTYFDTSFAYHNGTSEDALRQAVVERLPRETFTIATKLPTFSIQTEDQVEPIFARQLQNLGTDYVDYYLLHTLNRKFYDGPDGHGGVVKACHLFEHAKKWKDEGKVRHIGFSFHDSAEELDHILSEHPEVEFVQIIINYFDWESYFIQSRRCYEVIRKYGKKVVVMEPVKGGYLAQLPEAELLKLRALRPDWTPAAWALHFAQSQEGVIAVLSGMSTLAQVEDNVTSMKDYESLTEDETKLLAEIARDLKKEGPEKESDFTKYEGIRYHGIPVSDILDSYNSAMVQPNPLFSGEMNYLPGRLLANGVTDIHQEFPEEQVIFEGKDITPQVKEAWDFLVEHAFTL